MKFKLGKHKTQPDVDVVEVYDQKDRLIATVELGDDEKEGHILAVVSDYIDRVGFSGGNPPGILIKFLDKKSKLAAPAE